MHIPMVPRNHRTREVVDTNTLGLELKRIAIGIIVPRVLVTCRSILQLVILGVESKRVVPDWMLRLANDRVAWDTYPWGLYVWPTVYYKIREWQSSNVGRPCMSMSLQMKMIPKSIQSLNILRHSRYFDRYNRYPRVAAWNKKKGRFLGPMVIPFFEGNMPAARLTPDDNEARSDWWISSRAYFDGFIGRKDVQGPERQENKESIIADQHYGLSDFTQFQSTQVGHRFPKPPMQSYQTGSSVWKTDAGAVGLLCIGNRYMS
ncbi:hypothetical protein Tco_0064727 [Tanacetum coccineum]